MFENFSSFLGNAGTMDTAGNLANLNAPSAASPSQGGFMNRVGAWLGNPENQLMLAQLGRGVSPQGTFGANLADAIIPGLKGQVSQQKSEDVKIGSIPISALASPHVTGVTHKLPDGTTTSVKSPGPKDYTESQIIAAQQAAGTPPSPSSPTPIANATQGIVTNVPGQLPISASLNNQGPFVGSQAVAGQTGDAVMPAIPHFNVYKQMAAKYNVPLPTVLGLAEAESKFNPAAVSSTGVTGPMQVTKATGRDIGFTPDQLATPEGNIEAGVKYLRTLADRGVDLNNPNQVVNAYTTVAGGATPAYARIVGNNMAKYASLSGNPMFSQVAAPTPAPEAPVPVAAPEIPQYSVNMSPGRIVRGLSPEEVNQATLTGIQQAHAPYQNMLTASQALHAATEAEAVRQGIPTKAGVSYKGVTVTGKDYLDSLNKEAEIASHLKYYSILSENAKTQTELRDATRALKESQDAAIRIKTEKDKQRADLINGPLGDTVIPGANLTYKQADALGIADDLIKGNQQAQIQIDIANRAVQASIRKAWEDKTKALTTDPLFRIKVEKRAKEAKTTTHAILMQDMAAEYGANWRDSLAIQQRGAETTNASQPGEPAHLTYDPKTKTFK